MRKNTLIIIFLLLSVSIIYGEQKIFISAKLKGNDLRKEIIKWVKNKAGNNKFNSYDNGLVYLFYVSNNIIDNNSLCFDINFHIEYDKFIVDFSNIKLLNNETGDAEKLKFSIWSTLTNSGWFREYNDTITMLVEELENIIKL
ncbi:hypothetical protein [uncultured Brachyspira sp.]|uniref:hypothetical protein n=1 Tax=uncultured Brachyspira sp. TaxID=221953 RepID=UPI002627DCEE|nr:hypothetical protein [uncultured Brachyspira sp.]